MCSGIKACGDGGSRTRQREKLGCWVVSAGPQLSHGEPWKLQWPSELGPEGWAFDAHPDQSLAAVGWLATALLMTWTSCSFQRRVIPRES